MKTKTLSIVLASLLLSACAVERENLKQTRDIQAFTLVLQIVPKAEITVKCAALGVPYESQGCSSYNYFNNTCTIYAPKLGFVEDIDRLSTLGHELWHCKYGEFHE